MKDLYIQILIGAHYYEIFWFQFNLIFLSLLFIIISYIAKKNLLYFLEFLSIISLYLNISCVYHNYFKNFKIKIQKSIGCLNEILPLTVIGCVYGHLNLLSTINNLNWFMNCIWLSLIYLIFEYNIFISYSGFLYPNIIRNVFTSTLLFLFFGSIKLTKYPKITFILKYLSSYTGGIYYIHDIFHKHLYFIFNIKNPTYFSAFIIYIICYFICYFGHKKFKNYNSFFIIFIKSISFPKI